MATIVATVSFFPTKNGHPNFEAKKFGRVGGTIPASINTRDLKLKSSGFRKIQVKANAKVNRPKIGVMDTTFDEVTESFSFLLGGFVQGGYVFRQNFSIRSYEIGPDKTASIETVMNHLQETALNHAKNLGFLSGGFGVTPEMCKRNLIWVVTKMQLLVDRYPSWGDVIQVDTSVAASGKNGMRRDWFIRDTNNGDVLIRASSLWAMMNKETRKLAKIPEEVRAEIECHFVDTPPIICIETKRLPKLDDERADYVCTGLTPRWTDLDVNQHVNNVKYISWILESSPTPMLESHELASMTLEYRRECRNDSRVESLTAILGDNKGGDMASFETIECQHLLRFEDGPEMVKGITEWRPKSQRD